MADKAKAPNRLGIIERVTTPLGFFTLGVLVIEGILASLSIRATGIDLTILIVGMLIGFALLCVMVFVLAMFPQFRSALLGVADYSPSANIAKMNLTANDIRLLYMAHHNHGQLFEYTDVILGGSRMPWTQRLRKLYKLGLITRPLDPMRLSTEPESLTSEGRALAGLIVQFSQSLLELQSVGKLPRWAER